jgi:ABC-type methionine transport system ATPase subunit
MGPDESDELGDRLLVLRREFALTILLIEHHVPLVLRVCDHVYVLNFGRLLAEGKPSVIQTHPEVVAAYLGGEAPEALEATQETAEDAELEHQLEDALEHHDERVDDHDQPTEAPVDDEPATEVLEAAAVTPRRPPTPRSAAVRKPPVRKAPVQRTSTAAAPRPKRAPRRTSTKDDV